MATIEGRNPVIEAIKNDREIDKIMIANSAKEGSIKKIIGMAKEKNIDKSKLNKVSGNTTGLNSDYFNVTTDKKLYERLREYRLSVSKLEGVLPYMVLSSNSLKEISGRYPLDEEQLKDIGGVGPVKINKYGEDIINIVKEYIKENNITPKWEEKKRLKLVIDGDSRKNEEIALDLLNQNKDINDIFYRTRNQCAPC